MLSTLLEEYLPLPEVLAIPVYRKVNISIRDKVYPKEFKRVKGFPVFNKGSRHDKS